MKIRGLWGIDRARDMGEAGNGLSECSGGGDENVKRAASAGLVDGMKGQGGGS
jgi:hypothetical protein